MPRSILNQVVHAAVVHEHAFREHEHDAHEHDAHEHEPTVPEHSHPDHTHSIGQAATQLLAGGYLQIDGGSNSWRLFVDVSGRLSVQKKSAMSWETRCVVW